MDSDFHAFVRHVMAGEVSEVARCLAKTPALAAFATDVGATREDPATWYFPEIARYLYAGDTALHVAAAAFRCAIAQMLVAHGADSRARNRRGAEALHYAADGNHWDPKAQAEIIAYLVSIGADANVRDKSRVTPLHRAVRTRSAAAVRALLDAGADPRAPNGAGSTPLHLAVQGTGRGGSGSEQGRQEQTLIISQLLERGASPDDLDGRGRSVHQAASSAWVRALIAGTPG